MHTTSVCLNCNNELQDDFKHCPYCGQLKEQRRFSISSILHHFMHAFTHADRSAVKLLYQMATRPGKVMREYILEGKRSRYFNPFTLLLIVLGIAVFVNSVFHPFTNGGQLTPQQQEMLQQFNPAQQEMIREVMQKQIHMNQFLESRTNIVLLFSTPFMAFMLWLFFRKKAKYAEHLVAYVMICSILSLFSTFVITPLLSVAGTQDNFLLITIPSYAVQIGYMSWAYVGFMELKGKGVWRAILASIAANIFLILIISIIVLVYMFLF